MEFFKPGLVVDFMRHRTIYFAVSATLVVLSIVSFFFPGPKWGIDFAGGTEVQLRFDGAVSSAELRNALEDSGYDNPDVVAVVGNDNEYIVRLREVSNLSDEQKATVRELLMEALGEVTIEDLKFSPGGDKVSLKLSDEVEPSLLEGAMASADLEVRSLRPFGPSSDHRWEVELQGVAQEMVNDLAERFPERQAEELRVEWVGPRAGEQLRDRAIQALLYAIVFIMVYVAFRFDLRYAPGAVIAMAHDATITFGIFVLLQKEFNLTIVAALLTIIGYSINDTIVVYDRIRENIGRYRDKPLYDVINISTSQMLSRTIVTSGTTLLSVSAFFLWGTSVIRDISFALFIGILIGTYSSIYVAAPLTEWMDRNFFRRAAGAAGRVRRPAKA